MSPLPPTHPLRRWLSGLVESTFNTEVGLCDPAVLSYIADLLTEFIHVERINQAADGSGRQIEDLAELLCQVESPTPTADSLRRELYRHIGDFTLFWTGVYPENLRRMHRRQAGDGLLDYFEQGKRSYALASELGGEAAEPPGFVLHALSDQFEYCVYGLGLVRKNWEHDSPDRSRQGGILH